MPGFNLPLDGLRSIHPSPGQRTNAIAMSTWKPSSRASQMLDHHRLRGRSYPTQRYWDRLYQMLEEEAERRGKTPPPPPISYALDHEPTDDDKVQRLLEQLAWADRNNLLHRIQMFFDAMPSSGWKRTGK
jgi:hypothetical protein